MGNDTLNHDLSTPCLLDGNEQVGVKEVCCCTVTVINKLGEKEIRPAETCQRKLNPDVFSAKKKDQGKQTK